MILANIEKKRKDFK